MYTNPIVSREVIAVAPTTTVLVPAIDVTTGLSAVRLEIINDDLAQTLSVAYEKSETADGPWSPTNYDFFRAITPGESRMDVVDVRYLKFIRVVGTASGAGLDARVSACLFTGESSW